MWGRKPEVVIEEPRAEKPVVLSSGELVSYKAVAAKIGLTSPAIVEADILVAIDLAGVGLYDYEKVRQYLGHKFTNGWHWAPLREKDATVVASATTSSNHRIDWPDWVVTPHSRYTGILSREQYAESVPHPVLITVDKISTAVPDALFFVSAPGPVTYGDPFLMVCAKGGTKRFVIERWDEPSFR